MRPDAERGAEEKRPRVSAPFPGPTTRLTVDGASTHNMERPRSMWTVRDP
jgi:hypothetical protein